MNAPYLRRAWVLAASLIAVAACDDPPEQAPAAAPAASSAGVPDANSEPRCRSGRGRAHFTLGQLARKSAPAEQDLGLPFSVELGSAVVVSDHFAVSALREQKDGTHAVVALVDRRGKGGRIVDLDKVHGVVVPPQLAAGENRLFVAIADSDASGMAVRLARVDSIGGEVDVTRGANFHQGNDESQAFGVALGGSRGVVVWDEWDEEKNHGAVLARSFAEDDISSVTDPVLLSAEEADAESPRVASRPGGYWVGWIENAPRDENAELGEGRAATVELGHRRVVLRPVDAAAKPSSKALSVTSEQGHVLAFDLAPAPGGGAWVAWREDTTSVATPGGVLGLARVGADGSVARDVIEKQGLGATIPTYLVDRGAKGGARAWLAVADAADATLLGAIGANGRLLGELEAEPALRTAAPLVARDGEMLIARPRGRSVELEAIGCALR